MSRRLTKLGAVNRILRAASEAPLNSLDDIPSNETLLAQTILEEKITDLLVHGVANNTFVREFTPDEDTKKIVLPSNVIAVEAWGHEREGRWMAGRNFITTGTGTEVDPFVLFDLDEDTDEFDDSVILRIYIDMKFEELAPPLQLYVTTSASREYEAVTVGDRQQQQILMGEEQIARAKMKAFEIRMKRRNFFDHRARTDGPFAVARRVKRPWT